MGDNGGERSHNQRKPRGAWGSTIVLEDMFQLIWESSKIFHLSEVPQPCGPRLEGDTHNHTQTTVPVIAPDLFSVVRGTMKSLEVTRLGAEFRIKGSSKSEADEAHQGMTCKDLGGSSQGGRVSTWKGPLCVRIIRPWSDGPEERLSS